MFNQAHLLGPQWFRLFREKLAREWKTTKTFNVEGDKEWTRAMLDFLERLGKNEDYHIRREVGKRDMVWLRDESIEVHIEHENEGDDWNYLRNHEIGDLLMTDAKLRVLITYVKEKTYPANSHAGELGSLLDEKKSWGSELLFIVSPWEPAESADFIAHYYRPSFKHELLVVPSGRDKL